MNPVLEQIKNRKSTKKFTGQPVEKEKVEAVVEAGTWAPTGMNRQAPIILAVTNPEVRDAISKENAKILGKEGIDPFYGAPVILVVLADKNVPTHVYDGSVVMENMLLAADALDLGACWIHRAKEEFDSDFGKDLLKQLGIEGEYEGIGHVALGYPGGEFHSKPRKDNWVYWVE